MYFNKRQTVAQRASSLTLFQELVNPELEKGYISLPETQNYTLRGSRAIFIEFGN